MYKFKGKSTKGPVIQPKLKIGQPGDKYEQEADAVADRVMSMSDSNQVQMQPMEEEEEMMQPKIQMQPMEEEEEMMQPKIQMQPLEEEEEMLQPKLRQKPAGGMLQAKGSTAGEMEAPSHINEAVRASQGRGSAMSPGTRSFMEQRFGSDLSHVRIHNDAQSIQMNRELGSQAFTHKNNIFFNSGKYSPNTSSGKHLLAHELAHTFQQTGYKSPSLQMRSRLRTSSTGKPLIQRAVNTWGGTWDTDQYDLRRDKDPFGNAYPAARGVRGVDIKLKFTPTANADAKLIGLTQSVQAVVAGTPSYTDPTKKGRSIKAADAISIGTGAGHTDEGTSIDRVSSRNNPIYGSPSLGAGKGLQDTPVDNNSTANPTVVGNPNLPGGANATYQLGHRYKTGATWNTKDAKLFDGPTRGGAAKNSRHIFETTALALKGTQAGTYYGSVRWGWQTDNKGNFSKIPLAKVSEGTPSSTFMKAAELWNASKTSSGANTVNLPIEDVQLISNPAGVNIGLGPVYTHLPMGTRVVVMPGFPSMLESNIRVVDGPHTGETGKILNADMSDERS